MVIRNDDADNSVDRINAKGMLQAEYSRMRTLLTNVALLTVNCRAKNDGTATSKNDKKKGIYLFLSYFFFKIFTANNYSKIYLESVSTEDVSWLRQQVVTKEEENGICDKWSNLFDTRYNDLFQKKKPIQIVEEFKLLKSHIAPRLVNIYHIKILN